jgi:hypothetical protein
VYLFVVSRITCKNYHRVTLRSPLIIPMIFSYDFSYSTVCTAAILAAVDRKSISNKAIRIRIRTKLDLKLSHK